MLGVQQPVLSVNPGQLLAMARKYDGDPPQWLTFSTLAC
jgi:hypothetical protein